MTVPLSSTRAVVVPESPIPHALCCGAPSSSTSTYRSEHHSSDRRTLAYLVPGTEVELWYYCCSPFVLSPTTWYRCTWYVSTGMIQPSGCRPPLVHSFGTAVANMLPGVRGYFTDCSTSCIILHTAMKTGEKRVDVYSTSAGCCCDLSQLLMYSSSLSDQVSSDLDQHVSLTMNDLWIFEL